MYYKIEEMNTQENINYNRIAEAIDYIKANFKDQPNLDEVAEKVHLSPFHFQRLRIARHWLGIKSATSAVLGEIVVLVNSF